MSPEAMSSIKALCLRRPPIPGLQAAVWKELEPLREAMRIRVPAAGAHK